MVGSSTLASGVVIGLSIAAPVGPMAILCINRTLNAGIKAGISTGAGASTVTVAYASAVLLGLQQIGPFLAIHRPLMSTISAGLMLLFAWRTLSRSLGTGSRSDADSVIRNYGSAVAFNCLNPMLLVLLVGAVGAVIGPEPLLGPAVSTVLLGVFAGSVGWWIVLSAATSALRGQLSASLLRGINRVAATGMAGFAALSLSHVLGI
ncbi:LysE family translocator [Paracraurococcus lichenis]|uniref:LysE family transporter n=1 Tax=Paracraurococcus lichenis TaxID=3064888 RepID=A0ABT9E8S2_9PROT|nr:LysE family transporter [Paracraurococcus sp. LOR1-02]MDO9712596.1 LysE family transporter [Paracraurococcus sp. LOR1-02]